MENEIKIVNYGDISFNIDGRMAHCNEIEIKLTKTEFEVLKYFFQNIGRAISREELLNSVWGFYCAIETRATDDIVKRLRRKLSAVNSTVYITTLYGYGFRMDNKAR